MKLKDENLYLKKIAAWLEQLRFRKQLFGGVSEQEVWKKIEELNELYEAALKAERVRCDTLIAYFKRIGKEPTEELTADD